MADAILDGHSAPALAVRLALPSVELYERVSSTMDLAHTAAARGAAAGTLVLANAQHAGRGRAGRRWSSPPGSGLWMTLVERPTSPGGLDVLSLRAGLLVAESLDALAADRVQLKWPNDLYRRGGKLGGILIETRWRDRRIEWVAIGLGLNVAPPENVEWAAGLASGVTRLQALDCIVPALRSAAKAEGPLTLDELSRYAMRDLGVGRRVSEPAAGVVAGIGATGELMVDTPTGPRAFRSGSLVFSEGR